MREMVAFPRLMRRRHPSGVREPSLSGEGGMEGVVEGAEEGGAAVVAHARGDRAGRSTAPSRYRHRVSGSHHNRC